MDKDIATKNFRLALNRFDFERVRTCMGVLNWTWWDQAGTPSKQSMIETTYDLFNHSLRDVEKDNVRHRWGTGGFYVEVTPTNRVTIDFVVEDASEPF